MTKLGRGELIIALLLGSFPPMRKGLLWCHWISYYNVSIATDIFDLLTAICKRTRTKVALRNMLFLTQMELLSHGWQERHHLLVFGRFVPLHHNFHMGRSTLSAGFVCSKTPPKQRKHATTISQMVKWHEWVQSCAFKPQTLQFLKVQRIYHDRSP